MVELNDDLFDKYAWKWRNEEGPGTTDPNENAWTNS